MRQRSVICLKSIDSEKPIFKTTWLINRTKTPQANFPQVRLPQARLHQVHCHLQDPRGPKTRQMVLGLQYSCLHPKWLALSTYSFEELDTAHHSTFYIITFIFLIFSMKDHYSSSQAYPHQTFIMAKREANGHTFIGTEATSLSIMALGLRFPVKNSKSWQRVTGLFLDPDSLTPLSFLTC